MQVDDDGFVAIVAPDTYRGFVDEDWELEDVFSKFVEQMNAGSAFVVYPGPDGAGAPISFSDEAPRNATRSVSAIVTAGEGGLWLSDYTQLTMAAQFEDSKPTTKWSTPLPLEAGRYEVALHDVGSDDEPAYVLSAKPTGADASVSHTELPWYE